MDTRHNKISRLIAMSGKVGATPAGLLLLALLLMALLAAVGCGGGSETGAATPLASAGSSAPSGGPAATPAIDACALLTQAEVEAAVGRPVMKPQDESFPYLLSCNYGDPENAPLLQGRPLPVVSTTIVYGDSSTYGGSAATARASYDLGKKNAAAAQPVSGLGEDAYWDDTFDSLEILQGDYDISIQISPEDGGQSAARQLAPALLKRLP